MKKKRGWWKSQKRFDSSRILIRLKVRILWDINNFFEFCLYDKVKILLDLCGGGALHEFEICLTKKMGDRNSKQLLFKVWILLNAKKFLELRLPDKVKILPDWCRWHVLHRFEVYLIGVCTQSDHVLKELFIKIKSFTRRKKGYRKMGDENSNSWIKW